MSHLDHSSSSRIGKTSPEWLSLGGQITAIANKYSGRNDLIAFIGEGAGGTAPACYVPKISEIEVNLDIAFGDDVSSFDIGDMTKRKVQYEFPRATGAILHEAFHAKYSQWDMEQAYKELDEDKAVLDALVLLEEGRIEYQGMLDNPKTKVFLRSCAMDIVIGDQDREKMESQASTITLTNLVGLVHARVDSGILKESAVESVMEICEKQLGKERIEKLRDIAKRAREWEEMYDASGMYPLAKEWVEVMKEIAEERGEDISPEGQSGEGQGMSMGDLEELLDALEDAGVQVSVESFSDLADQEQKEKDQEVAKSKAEKAEERKEEKDVAKKIFSKSSGGTDTRTSSRLHEQRDPTPAERSSAVRIGQALDKAKYRERDVTEVASIVPPGRLKTRAIVQNSALRARGQMGTAKPFTRKVRKHTDDPTLSIGIMVDISGSMGSAMNPMASTAWILAEAGHRVQAKVAMVYYGNSVFPTLKVGERHQKVNVYTAPDGTEVFHEAFQAINGALELTYERGARLLVIVSDGHYAGREPEKAKEAIARCKEAGVAVLWIPFDDGVQARRLGGEYVEVVTGISKPEEASEVIARSALRVLSKVGQRASA